MGLLPSYDVWASHCSGFSCGALALGRSGSLSVALRLSCSMACWSLVWDLPRPGIKPASPALADGFLTTGPPGKSPSTTFGGEGGPEGKTKQEGHSSIRMLNSHLKSLSRGRFLGATPEILIEQVCCKAWDSISNRLPGDTQAAQHRPLNSPVTGDRAVRKWGPSHQDLVLWKHLCFVCLFVCFLSLYQFTHLHDFIEVP